MKKQVENLCSGTWWGTRSEHRKFILPLKHPWHQHHFHSILSRSTKMQFADYLYSAAWECCVQKTYILSLSHHFQASLHWRSKLYSRAWWGTRSGHRYHILRILHPWQDFLLRLLNVTISSCCTLPGIGRNLRRNIVEHLQLKWNKCWHVHYLKEVGCWVTMYAIYFKWFKPLA